MMRRLFCLPLFIVLLSLANVAYVQAADVFQGVCTSRSTSTLCTEAGKNQDLNDNGLFGVHGILNKAATFLLVVVGIAAVIMVIVGGVQYAISGGDPQRINRAKDTIIYALVGAVIAILAKGIIAFVINRVA